MELKWQQREQLTELNELTVVVTTKNNTGLQIFMCLLSSSHIIQGFLGYIMSGRVCTMVAECAAEAEPHMTVLAKSEIKTVLPSSHTPMKRSQWDSWSCSITSQRK